MWEAFIDGHSTGQLSVTAHALGTWLEPARVRKNIWLTVWGDTVQHGWGGKCGRQKDQEVAYHVTLQSGSRKWTGSQVDYKTPRLISSDLLPTTFPAALPSGASAQIHESIGPVSHLSTSLKGFITCEWHYHWPVQMVPSTSFSVGSCMLLLRKH